MSTKKQPARYYIPHHLILYPVMGILIFFSFQQMTKSEELKTVWLAIALCFISVTAVSFMLRQHYALGNQDRIIRLEMKYRYFAITGKRFETLEQQLSFKQIAALRFASDEELSTLVAQTLNEKLSPSQVKDRIVNWVPDTMRL